MTYNEAQGNEGMLENLKKIFKVKELSSSGRHFAEALFLPTCFVTIRRKHSIYGPFLPVKNVFKIKRTTYCQAVNMFI